MQSSGSRLEDEIRRKDPRTRSRLPRRLFCQPHASASVCEYVGSCRHTVASGCHLLKTRPFVNWLFVSRNEGLRKLDRERGSRLREACNAGVLQSGTATCSSHAMKEPFDRQPKGYWLMLPRLEYPATYPEGLFWWFGLLDIYEISTVPSIHPVQKPRLAAIVSSLIAVVFELQDAAEPQCQVALERQATITDINTLPKLVLMCRIGATGNANGRMKRASFMMTFPDGMRRGQGRILLVGVQYKSSATLGMATQVK